MPDPMSVTLRDGATITLRPIRPEDERELTRLILDTDLNTDHIRSDQLGKAYRLDDARGRYIEFLPAPISSG